MTSKKKVTRKKRVKKKSAPKKRVRSLPIVSKGENGIVDADIVYTNGTGKPDNGRPPKYAKLSQIKGLASIGCTQQEMAAILGMNKCTFTELKQNNESVETIIIEGRAEGKGSIRKKQHDVAVNQGDPSMLRWLGKHRLDQLDVVISHVETSTGDSLKKEITDEMSPSEAAKIYTQEVLDKDD